MKILCVTQDFPPTSGGIAVFLHNLCAQLCRLGRQVDVITPTHEGAAEADARQLYQVQRYISCQRLSSIIPILRTLALHRRNNYDLVFIGHFMTTHALGALTLHKLWGVPYMILAHGKDLSCCFNRDVDGIVARLLVRNTTLMLANSRFTAVRIREVGYYGPIEVLNPGVDPKRFHPEVDTAEVRQKYNLDNHHILLTVGRLVKRKNIQGVLHALPKVVKHVPNLLYLVVGDGEERKSLQALSEQLRLSSYVKFLDHVSDELLPALYCASNLFVMPSLERESGKDYEGFGIVFIEANACGKPVIAGRSGGIEDAVIEGQTGLLVNSSNVAEIAAAILRLLTDNELRQRLGQNGRRRAVRELSWEKVGERLEMGLTSVLKIDAI